VAQQLLLGPSGGCGNPANARQDCRNCCRRLIDLNDFLDHFCRHFPILKTAQIRKSSETGADDHQAGTAPRGASFAASPYDRSPACGECFVDRSLECRTHIGAAAFRHAWVDRHRERFVNGR
jgi:hypothetical protein